MRTTVTTNGTLLARVPRFAGLIDLLAISLDGPQDLHNRVRASDRAFDLLVCGLDDVRRAGVKFGFIHTLTRESWEHLPWLADFAVEQGAVLLQLHPLELAGRAGELMRGDRPEDDTLARAYLLATTLASKYEGRLTIQLDVFHTEHLLEYPELAYAADLGPDLSIYRAADLLSPVVVEADATVVPVCYGFSRDYAICNLKEEALAAAWPRYLRERYPMFASLCRRVFKEATIPRDLPFLNWYELILASSRATAFAQAAL